MAYNLQGIIRKASTNMTVEFDRLGYITQNFANVNTNGYKSVRFEDIIDADVLFDKDIVINVNNDDVNMFNIITSKIRTRNMSCGMAM